MHLADYTWPQVKKAFVEYTRREVRMPKPADIIKIIEPEKPKFCKVAYLEIKKKQRENAFVTSDEIRYCEDFVDTEINTHREFIEQTLQQEKLEHKKYWGMAKD